MYISTMQMQLEYCALGKLFAHNRAKQYPTLRAQLGGVVLGRVVGGITFDEESWRSWCESYRMFSETTPMAPALPFHALRKKHKHAIAEHARRRLACGPLQEVGVGQENLVKRSLLAKRPAARLQDVGKRVLKDLKQKPSGRSRVTMYSRRRSEWLRDDCRADSSGGGNVELPTAASAKSASTQ